MVDTESLRTQPGVVYLPSLPPYMDAQKLRHLLSKYCELGRIYLTPEDPVKYANRVKTGGCKKGCFTEGWVEFPDKREAKKLASLLNGQQIGGKKRHNFYRDDTWCMRYLHRFTWNDLMEHRVHQRQINQKRLQAVLSKQKREDEFFLDSVSKKRQMDSAELRRKVEGTHDESRRKSQTKSLPRQKFAFEPKKARLSDKTGSSDLLDALAL